VDVALYESVFSVMESLLPEFDAFGAVRERTGSILPGIAPSSAYRCGDGSFVLIGANADSIFKRLCRAMGRDDLAADPSLAHNDGRAARQAWLDGEIEADVRAHATVARRAGTDVPASKIYSIADIVADHYAAADDPADRKRDGDARVPGVVPAPATPAMTAAARGWAAHQRGTAGGYDAAAIADLRTRRDLTAARGSMPADQTTPGPLGADWENS
jgi:formyl-CoA transferase